MFNNRKIVYVLFLGLLSLYLTSCVAKSRFEALEQQMQTAMDDNKKKMDMLQGMYNDADSEKNKCIKELAELHVTHKKLEKDNRDLAEKANQILHETEDLKLELKKKQSIIQLQEGVIKQINETKNKIETTLKKQIEKQEIKIEDMEGKIKVTFIDKILFDSGSSSINEKGKSLLLDIAGTLKEDTLHYIRVEGHTDNIPIGKNTLKAVFPTNWELSVARATAVVRFLQESGEVQPQKLSACGYSYYRPVATNDTVEGRSQNRRIEIILIPSY